MADYVAFTTPTPIFDNGLICAEDLLKELITYALDNVEMPDTEDPYLRGYMAGIKDCDKEWKDKLIMKLKEIK